MTRTVPAAMCTLLLSMLGCGSSPTGTAVAALVGVDTTDAEVGKPGKLRVRFDNPVGQNSDVTLLATDAGVARLPMKVTVPRGALSAEIAYDGLALGNSAVYATSGDTTVSESLTVLPHFALDSLEGDNRSLEPGAVTQLRAFLNGRPPTPVQIAVGVDTAAVVKLSAATATVSPYSSLGQITMTALAPGAAQVTGTLGSDRRDTTVTVVDHARLNSAGGSSEALYEVGAMFRADVSVDAAVAKNTAIAASSSDATVAAAPTVSIAAGQTSVQYSLPVLGEGSTVITFTLADSTATTTLSAVATAHLASVNASGVLGQSNNGSIQLAAVAGSKHTIMLSSSDPTILAVPAQVSISKGSSNVGFTVSALKAGAATITATSGGDSISTIVNVRTTAPTFGLFVSPRNAVMVGATLRLSINSGLPTPTQLTSSDPTVLSVPAIVAPGFQDATATGLRAGMVTVTATSGSATTSVDLRVVATADFSLDPSISIDTGGVGNTSQILFEAVVPAGTQATFTSSNTAVVPAPDPISADGMHYILTFPITGLATGTAVLTVTALGIKHSTVVYVSKGSTPPPFLLSANTNTPTLEVGAIATGFAQLSRIVPADVPVSVTVPAVSPAVVTVVDASPVVTAGQNVVSFPLVAQNPGTAVVTVSSGGVVRSFTVTVVAAPTFTISVAASIVAKTTVTGTVFADCLLAKDRVFALTSSNSAIATVSPAMVTMSIFGGSAQFDVTGVATGSSTITATPQSGTSAPATQMVMVP